MIDEPVLEEHEQSLVAQDSSPSPPSETRVVALSRTLQELIALERERLESTNKRTEVALKAIEASDAADKRQYEYHVEKLRTTAQQSIERRRAIIRIVSALGGAAALVAALLLLMLFFGTDVQREIARELLGTGLAGLGGAGILWLLRAAFERAMSENGRDT